MKFKIIIFIIMLSLIIYTLLNLKNNSKSEKNYKIETINGVKIFLNEKDPSDESITLTPKKRFSINSENIISDSSNNDIVEPDSSRLFTSPADYDIDSEGNIYILDVRSSSVKQFDSEGNFIRSIGRVGSGPGEMIYPRIMNIIQDTILVFNMRSQNIVKFNTKGEYTSTIQLEEGNGNFPILENVCNTDRMLGLLNKWEETDKGFAVKTNLVIIDKSFNEIVNLKKENVYFEPKRYNLIGIIPVFTSSEKEIFIAKNSMDEYRINVYDKDGKINYSIRKKYSKIKFDKIEFLEFKEHIKRNFGGSAIPEKNSKYKQAINRLFYDSENNWLLVGVSVDRKGFEDKKYYFDIFRDGVFLKRVSTDIFKGNDFHDLNNHILFKNGRIYHLSRENTELNVYDY